MNDDRLAYALAHPLNGVQESTAPYTVTELQRDGNILLTVLAVDR